MGLFKKKTVKKSYDREHMKPIIRNVTGMIKRFHTVTGDSYTEVGLVWSEMVCIVSFSYRVLQIISSTSRNWFPGDFYRLFEWENLCRAGENILEILKISANSMSLFLLSNLYGFSPKKAS